MRIRFSSGCCAPCLAGFAPFGRLGGFTPLASSTTSCAVVAVMSSPKARITMLLSSIAENFDGVFGENENVSDGPCRGPRLLTLELADLLI